MAIAFGSVATSSNDGAAKANSYSQAVPSGLAANDLLLLLCGNTAPDNFNTPSGWTELQDLLNSGPNDVDGAADSKTATGSESAFTVGTGGIVTTIGGSLLRYTGVQSVRGSAAVAASATSTTSPAPPAVAGVVSTDMVIHAYIYGDNASQAANVRNTALSAPSGWTQRASGMYAPNAAGQFNLGILVCDKLGGTDNPTVTTARTGGWTILTIVLKAAVSDSAIPPTKRTRQNNYMLVR